MIAGNVHRTTPKTAIEHTMVINASRSIAKAFHTTATVNWCIFLHCCTCLLCSVHVHIHHVSTEASTTFSKRRSTATASNAIHYDQSNSLIFHLFHQGFLSLEAISRQNECINRHYTYFARNFVLMIVMGYVLILSSAPEAHCIEPCK